MLVGFLALGLLASFVGLGIGEHACSSRIFCYGGLLDTVQSAQIFLDPKRFVDMPAKRPTPEILEDFERLGPKKDRPSVEKFLKRNFHRAGYDLRIVMPKDIKDGPAFLEGVRDEGLRKFGLEIHNKWKSLLRVVDKTKLCPGCESTALDLPYPFVVPGGRFREYYYWDTYWILEGLYVSEMCLTAKSVIRNTLWLVEKYGFVPNGARSYYLNRSQPPLLPVMVERFMAECGKNMTNPSAFLKYAVEILDKEHSFWMQNRAVSLTTSGGTRVQLNHYGASMAEPRPESYIHDVSLAKDLPSPAQKKRLYNNIAGAAESGWDFSGRWMNWTAVSKTREFPELRTTMASRILPVDLNVVLLNNEHVMSTMWRTLGNETMAAKYQDLQKQRTMAIQTFLYVESESYWRDYDCEQGRTMADRPFYITDLCPLWYAPFLGYNASVITAMLRRQDSILHKYPGGIPISEVYTTQQWDFPNVWAPIQYQVIRLYQRLYEETADSTWQELAIRVAQRWIDSTYCGYKQHGYIFEKYNAKYVGQPGGGGEYTVQEGFGWSNGVILWVMQQYGQHLTIPLHCPKIPIAAIARALETEESGEGSYGPGVFLVLSIFGGLAGIIVCISEFWKRRKRITYHVAHSPHPFVP